VSFDIVSLLSKQFAVFESEIVRDSATSVAILNRVQQMLFCQDVIRENLAHTFRICRLRANENVSWLRRRKKTRGL